MEVGPNLRARMSRAPFESRANPKDRPAMAKQYLGRSLDPLTATIAMLRKTGAKGALEEQNLVRVAILKL